MQDIHTDVAVIGAGTAGLSAYRTARQQGARAVLIEGGAYGTTCARVGCMPSKLLIAAAEAAEAVREAHGFGIHASAPKIDGQAVMARVRSERDRFVGFVLEGVTEIPEADRLRGYARFEDLRTLVIDDHTRVHARSVVIATGSTPFIPPILAGLGDRLIINDQVFDWEDLPRSVAVFGAGYWLGTGSGPAPPGGARAYFWCPSRRWGLERSPAQRICDQNLSGRIPLSTRCAGGAGGTHRKRRHGILAG